MYSFELRFAKVYKAFSSEVHAFRLVFSGWGVKSLSTYPMTVGSLEKKVIHGTSEPTMSWLKRFLFALRCDLAKFSLGNLRGTDKSIITKKTVKSGQARTRESEEYKAEAKDSKRTRTVKPRQIRQKGVNKSQQNPKSLVHVLL
ncbi:hypothetical protein Tco_0979160 [Tanacetum coccineum]